MTKDEYELQKSLNLIFQQLEILKLKITEERTNKRECDTQKILYDLLKENFKYKNPLVHEKDLNEEILEEIRALQLTEKVEIFSDLKDD